MIRVALVGSRAEEMRASLASHGFDVSFVHDADPSLVDVLVALSDAPPFELEPWRGIPSILVANEISNEAIAAAASLRAVDVVLSRDERRLVEAIEEAGTRSRGAGLPSGMELELLRKFLDVAPNSINVCDAAGRFVVVSQSFADFYATTIEDLVGESIETILAPQDLEATRAENAEVIATCRSRVSERDVCDRSGSKRRVSIVKRPLLMDDGTVLVLTVASDVTRRFRTEAALENANDFLKNILETITDAVFALDLSGKFTLVNRRLVELTGLTEPALLATPFTNIFSGQTLHDAKRHISELFEDPRERDFEGRLTHPDGSERIVSCSLLPLMRQDTFVGIVGTAEDVTERHLAQRRIAHLAYHDPLTNLPNRRLLTDRLQIALSQAMRDGRSVALFFLDLDRFKAINDTLGHRVGDLLLQELGTRLRECVRQGDTVARMGGDEFVFVIPGLNRIDEAVSTAEKILETVRRPFIIEGRELALSACIGMSDFPEHATDADALLRQADIALFECKNGGRDTWRAYTASMSMRSSERQEREADLRRALRDGEFQLYYQPIVNLCSGEICGAEALLRWEHPQRGLLLPDDFIDLAEDTGTIVALGEWALHEAARQNAQWQQAGLGGITTSVNVSARQFGGPIVNTVRSALRSARLDARYLALELSESSLGQSSSSPKNAIAELKSLGVDLTIDDFGTGYSSLLYLERFPLDGIKIDRIFMQGDFSKPAAGFVAGAIISLAAGIGLRVSAEGIETAKQAEFLISRGCTTGQGHLYYAALPPCEMERLLRGDLGDRILA